MSADNHFYASLSNRESLLQEDLMIVNRRLLALLDSVALLQQHGEKAMANQKFLNNKMDGKMTPHYSILLIEDNLVAQRISQSQLKSFNCAVDIVGTGADALQQLESKHYDLVLLDIGLPDYDGRDIIREIRSEQTCPNRESPVIALTAHLPDEEKHTCFEVGIDHILYKPLTRKDIKSIFNMFLDADISLNHEAAEFNDQANDNASDSPEISASSNLPVIDLATAATLMQCNQENVKRLLAMLVETLPEEQASLEEAYQTQSWEQLRKTVHKLNGGSGYCGVPRLKKSCADLESILILEQHNQAKIDATYQTLLQEIAAILEAFSKL